MVSDNVIRGISQGTNHVAQAFGAKQQQLDQKRLAEQQQRDNDMHKVFSYAGDGFIDEARFLAQQKGLQVPDEIFKNATFAKGLSIAGSIYGDDPERAAVFTDAFMRGDGDLMNRFNIGLQTAGKPVSRDEREFQNFVRKEQWKLKNMPRSGGGGFSLSAGQARYDANGNIIAQAPEKPPISRFEAMQKTRNAAVQSGIMSPEQVEAEVQKVAAEWDALYGGSGTQETLPVPQPAQAPAPEPSQGLIGSLGNAALNTVIPGRMVRQYEERRSQQQEQTSPAISPQPQSQQAQLEGINTLIQRGYSPEQIEQGLVSRGMAPEMVRNAINQATASQQQVQSGAVQAPMPQMSGYGFPVAPVSPVEQNNQSGYFQINPTDSRIDSIAKNLANVTNVPEHLRSLYRGYRDAGSAIIDSVPAAAGSVKRGLINTQSGVEDWLNQSPQVVMYSPEGQLVYVPRNNLQDALGVGFRLAE